MPRTTALIILGFIALGLVVYGLTADPANFKSWLSQAILALLCATALAASLLSRRIDDLEERFSADATVPTALQALSERVATLERKIQDLDAKGPGERQG